MTVLAACQKASQLMGLTAPSQVYGSTSRYEVELQAVANEAARAITAEHDWRKLTTLKTQAGDGSSTSFSLPSDYDRMPMKAKIFLTSTTEPMRQIIDLDEWMHNRLQSMTANPGEWIILGGTLQIYSGSGPIGASDSAKYYYQSNKRVLAEDGTTTKAAFTLDTDSFVLDETMLALEIIWRWRAMKGLEYGEDMQNAGIAKAQQIARDKGSRMLAIGQPRIYGDVPTYPGTLSAS